MFGYLVGLVPILLFWGLIVMIVGWFIRTLTTIASALREISERLRALEQAVRQAAAERAT